MESTKASAGTSTHLPQGIHEAAEVTREQWDALAADGGYFPNGQPLNAEKVPSAKGGGVPAHRVRPAKRFRLMRMSDAALGRMQRFHEFKARRQREIELSDLLDQDNQTARAEFLRATEPKKNPSGYAEVRGPGGVVGFGTAENWTVVDPQQFGMERVEFATDPQKNSERQLGPVQDLIRAAHAVIQAWPFAIERRRESLIAAEEETLP